MMKLVSMLLTLCMVFCMLTVPAAADDLPVVKLDVGTTETYDDTNYKVDANTIILRAEDRVYELTGTTDRKILVPGTSTPAEPKTYHIRLNNATINGGVTINNSTGAKLVIEVAAGTVNTVKHIYSASLTITGSGTLNMEDMGVTQSTRTNNLAPCTLRTPPSMSTCLALKAASGKATASWPVPPRSPTPAAAIILS